MLENFNIKDKSPNSLQAKPSFFLELPVMGFRLNSRFSLQVPAYKGKKMNR